MGLHAAPEGGIPIRPSPREGGRVRPIGVQGDFTIYLTKPLLEEIVAHAEGDKSRPRGGFLLGNPCRSNDENFVELKIHLPAEQGIGRGGAFTFTKTSFAELANQMELWPGTSLVGWYYTHLGTGLFLSAQDQDLHQKFFNQRWMVALVIDVVSGGLSFFQWKGKSLLPCGFSLF